VLISEEPTNGR